MQIKKLKKYITNLSLSAEIEDQYLTIGDKTYRIILDGKRTLIDSDGNFIVGADKDDDVDGYLFEFGGRWYTQDADELEVQLNEFKNVGTANQKLPTDSFLGIRSSFEVMNGIGLYSEWVERAKFLNVKTLGICEHSTLSGVLDFQNVCKANGIKSIIGMTFNVKGEYNYELKAYVKNFEGWLNLLKFNDVLNVEENKSIEEDFVLKNSQGLILVADPKTMPFEAVDTFLSFKIKYYQLDTVNFLNEDRDSEYLDNLEKWMTGADGFQIKPIAITDAFYIDRDEWRTRELLWAVGKAFDDRTDNQYFKNKTQYASELIQMFDADFSTWRPLFKEALASESELVSQCNFIFDTESRHLPKYKMTDEEASRFETNDKLFLHLVKKGFKDRGIKEPQPYIERLKKEIDVLKQGDVIDYFLILNDIVQNARSKGMLTGVGRGSAAGSLVAYLLGIVHADPLEFGLLFERFLNAGRLGSYENRPAFEIITDDGEVVELSEGSVVRILRDNEQKIVFSQDLKEGDEILKY